MLEEEHSEIYSTKKRLTSVYAQYQNLKTTVQRKRLHELKMLNTEEQKEILVLLNRTDILEYKFIKTKHLSMSLIDSESQQYDAAQR
uniref:Uncharacterized protein n=1 Tax=Onchocerca volvulus TaxID=6282 RepID=A0A8R1XZE0_ONCVO